MAEDHVEIERAWIIYELPPNDLVSHIIPHDIVYLFSDEFGELRIVRRIHRTSFGMASNQERFSITVKSGGSLSRKEWEDDEFPKWSFDILWNKVENAIEKTRYFANFNEHLLEIDYYHNRLSYNKTYSDVSGKIRLECEFNSETEAADFVLPDWVKDAVEVTGWEEFRNKNIAANGWPDQRDLLLCK